MDICLPRTDGIELAGQVDTRLDAEAHAFVERLAVPGDEIGRLVDLEADAVPGVKVFHAGTGRIDSDIVTSGGRVLGVAARAASLDEALKLAYEAAERISFDGMHYRRDIGRFLRGERDTYPTMPHGYFDDDTIRTLTALRDRALSDRREEVLAAFPTALAAGKVTNSWRASAESLYRNWLLYLRAQKTRQLCAT